jgi:periplasmic divalent cation tolerance protein
MPYKQPLTDMEPIIVITNLPDRAQALSLAHKLVEERLAACVNVLGECTSVYRWEGENETASEVPVLIKTLAQHYAALEQLIRSLHPYELPELIAVPISGGLPAYLDWIACETSLSDKN